MRIGNLLTALIIAAPAMASEPDAYVSLTTGNHVYPMCGPAASEVRKNSCAWYMKGIIEAIQVHANPSQPGHSLLCMPDGLPGPQLTAIFGKYLDDHPEQRDEPALALVVRSMTKAFACPH